METNRSTFSSGLQKSIFEVIKAKHHHIRSYYSNRENAGLLLEMADMILLLSAQMASSEEEHRSAVIEKEDILKH